MSIRLLFSLILVSLVIQSAEVFGQLGSDIGIYEKLDSIIPRGIFCQDENNNRADLRDIIDKPTVLSFVYFECPGMCSPLLSGLSDVISKTDLSLGKDYQVITISFNYQDTPEKAMEKKKNFVLNMSKENAEHWKYLTTDSVTIDNITGRVGWAFKQTGRDFAHASAIIMVSPEGKITRYLYGIEYLPFDFKMAILEASEGLSRPTITKILTYCFNYDPIGNRYAIDVLKISATVILFFLGLFALVLFLKRKKGNPVK